MHFFFLICNNWSGLFHQFRSRLNETKGKTMLGNLQFYRMSSVRRKLFDFFFHSSRFSTNTTLPSTILINLNMNRTKIKNWKYWLFIVLNKNHTYAISVYFIVFRKILNKFANFEVSRTPKFCEHNKLYTTY